MVIKMEFRLAKDSEKNIILDLYNHDRNQPYTAWNEEYPTMDNIENDILHHNLFILEDNHTIIGSIAINEENELDDEASFSNQKALEFGRVIIHPDFRGNGYSKILVGFVEKEILKRGYQAIHICVYDSAKIAMKLYQSLGYKIICIKELFSLHSFYILEKALN